MGACPFAAGNLVLVSGIDEIVEDLEAARGRLRDVAHEFEDAGARDEYEVVSTIARGFISHYELAEDPTTPVLLRIKFGV